VIHPSFFMAGYNNLRARGWRIHISQEQPNFGHEEYSTRVPPPGTQHNLSPKKSPPSREGPLDSLDDFSSRLPLGVGMTGTSTGLLDSVFPSCIPSTGSRLHGAENPFLEAPAFRTGGSSPVGRASLPRSGPQQAVGSTREVPANRHGESFWRHIRPPFQERR
jgi:hypothetical protein